MLKQVLSISCFVLYVIYLAGIGMGMIYTPTILAVNFYFNKRRALATGIAICGSGIGIFVFAPLREYLLELYGWKGATWILSGLTLNCIALSLVYRPLPLKEYPEKQFRSNQESEKGNKQNDGQEMIIIHNNTLEVPTLYPSSGKNSDQISAENFEASETLLSCSGDENSHQTTGQKDFVAEMRSSVSKEIAVNNVQLWGSAVLTTFGSISNYPKTSEYSGRWGRFVATMIALKDETFNMHIMKMPTVIIFAVARFILGLGKMRE